MKTKSIRIKWQEVANVECETVFNLVCAVICGLFLIAILIAVCVGAWWQLLFAPGCLVLGIVSLKDNYAGNETAIHYLQRIFR